MITVFVLFAIFAFLATLAALLVLWVRKTFSFSEVLTVPDNKANRPDEDEHALKGVRSDRMFNIDGSLMVNSMIDSRGKPFGVSGS